MTLPNFIGLGAQRAATTWAFRCLREHPDVFLPDAKELHFFTNPARPPAAYEEQFRGHGGRKAVGEITPNYLASPEAVDALARTLPDAKLFVILREPVERAVSAYEYFYRRYFRGMSFKEACFSADYLMHFGRYGLHLRHVFQRFPRERVLVLLYDDVVAAPARSLAELFRFLEVDPDFRPLATHRVVNAGWKRRLGRLLGRQSPVYRREGPFLRWLRASYRKDILHLQSLIGRDLSAWLQPSPAEAAVPSGPTC